MAARSWRILWAGLTFWATVSWPGDRSRVLSGIRLRKVGAPEGMVLANGQSR